MQFYNNKLFVLCMFAVTHASIISDPSEVLVRERYNGNGAETEPVFTNW